MFSNCSRTGIYSLCVFLVTIAVAHSAIVVMTQNFSRFENDSDGDFNVAGHDAPKEQRPPFEEALSKTATEQPNEDRRSVKKNRRLAKSEMNDKEYSVTVNGEIIVGNLSHFWESTGLCPPEPHNESHKYFLSPDMTQNLAFIGAIPHSGIKWVRIHWLLDLITVTGLQDDKPVYNFTNLDKLMDQLFDNGLYPGFELMGNPSGYFTNFDEREQILGWRDFVRQIAQRYIGRYSLRYVRKWRFESWNEPDHHKFDSLNVTIQGFLNYYDACGEGLRLADANLIFGGPAASCKKPSYSKICWALLKHVAEGVNYFGGRSKLDFISFHVKGGRDTMGNSTSLLMDELNTTFRIWLAQPTLSHVPIVNDEADPVVGWSKALEWRADATYPAIVAKILVQHQSLFKLKSILPNYSLLSNDNGFLTWSPNYFTQRTLLARFQINNTQPRHVHFIRKPVYDLMGMLSLLGETQVGEIVTVNDQVVDELDSFFGALASYHRNSSSPTDSGELSILLYNSDDTKPTWGTNGYTVHFTLPSAMNRSRDLYYVQYSIDNSACNPYLWWQNLDHPDTPTPVQLEMMRLAQCPGRSQPPMPLGVSRRFSGRLSLPGVTLFHICDKPSRAPDQVSSVRFTNITYNQVLIVWMGGFKHSRCLKTYEVEYSPRLSGPYTRVNIYRDDTAAVYVHVVMPSRPKLTSVIGYYRVRAVDYWSRTGPYSSTVHYGGK